MDIRLAVAENLRNVREKRKLSLDAAAQLTGVSKSMLGQIERAEVNPTIAVVWRVAEGLKVSFSSLIEPPRAHAQVIAGAEIKPFVEDKGRFLNYPVFPFDPEKGFEQYRIHMKPGCAYQSEAHLPGTEEYILVFSGSLWVEAGEARYCLSQGDALCFHADVPRRYENRGDIPAELSMIIRYAG